MAVKITFVIGGARSGKSSFVLREVSQREGPRAYIATAEALDDEMADRIEKHKEVRGLEWDSYEEPVHVTALLSDIKDQYSSIVLDCLTLWLSNVLTGIQSTDAGAKALEAIEDFINELNRLTSLNDLNLYIVSNEVGMGIVPENDLAREFRDLAGFINQRVASCSDDVYLVAAGIPVKIK